MTPREMSQSRERLVEAIADALMDAEDELHDCDNRLGRGSLKAFKAAALAVDALGIEQVARYDPAEEFYDYDAHALGELDDVPIFLLRVLESDYSVQGEGGQ